MRKENIIDNEVSEILKCKDKRLPNLYNHKILYKGVEPYWQYKGKHICCKCNKEFGMTLEEAKRDCSRRTYALYKDKNVCNGKIDPNGWYCFNDFILKDKNKKHIKEYLKKNKLKIDNIEFRGEFNFNKILTKKQWDWLNSSCNKKVNTIEDFEREYLKVYGYKKSGKLYISERECSNCFKYNQLYYEYEKVVDAFRKFGINAELKYVCEDCKRIYRYNELEIWLKINGKTIVSYPQMSELKQSEYIFRESQTYTNGKVSFEKYMMILDFLKDKQNYKEYFTSQKLKQLKTNRLEIDRLLNSVLGVDVRYTKKDIFACLKFNQLQKQDDEISREVDKYIEAGFQVCFNKNLQNMIIYRTLCRVLNGFPDDYKFTIEEVFVIKSYIRLLFVDESEINLHKFNLDLRIDIVMNFIFTLLKNEETRMRKNLVVRLAKINFRTFASSSDKENEKQSKSIDYALNKLYKKFGDDYLIKTIDFLAFWEYAVITALFNNEIINKKIYYKKLMQIINKKNNYEGNYWKHLFY